MNESIIPYMVISGFTSALSALMLLWFTIEGEWNARDTQSTDK